MVDLARHKFGQNLPSDGGQASDAVDACGKRGEPAGSRRLDQAFEGLLAPAQALDQPHSTRLGILLQAPVVEVGKHLADFRVCKIGQAPDRDQRGKQEQDEQPLCDVAP